MKRFLARNVLLDGVPLGLSIVTFEKSGMVSVEPFTHEVHSTRYVEGTIEVTTSAGLLVSAYVNGRPLLFTSD